MKRLLVRITKKLLMLVPKVEYLMSIWFRRLQNAAGELTSFAPLKPLTLIRRMTH
jgi:hypothetical protein